MITLLLSLVLASPSFALTKAEDIDYQVVMSKIKAHVLKHKVSIEKPGHSKSYCHYDHSIALANCPVGSAKPRVYGHTKGETELCIMVGLHSEDDAEVLKQINQDSFDIDGLPVYFVADKNPTCLRDIVDPRNHPIEVRFKKNPNNPAMI